MCRARRCTGRGLRPFRLRAFRAFRSAVSLARPPDDAAGRAVPLMGPLYRLLAAFARISGVDPRGRWHAPVSPAPSELRAAHNGRLGTAPSRTESSRRRVAGPAHAAAAGNDATTCSCAALQQCVRVGQAARCCLCTVRRGTCVSASSASSTPTPARFAFARRCVGGRQSRRAARCAGRCVAARGAAAWRVWWRSLASWGSGVSWPQSVY